MEKAAGESGCVYLTPLVVKCRIRSCNCLSVGTRAVALLKELLYMFDTAL